MASPFEHMEDGDYMDKDAVMDRTHSLHGSIVTEIEKDFDGATNFISGAYNNTMSYLQSEFENLGMSDHQKVGIFFIFFLSTLLLVGSMAFLCCCGRRALCNRIKDEDRFIVYRRMVEFDHIISVEEDAKSKLNNKGKLSA